MHINAHPDMGEDPTAIGLLVWGVKRSFLRYVSRLPDGICEVSPQVKLPGQGLFGFPLTSSQGAPATSFRSVGSVTFRGHHDFLFVQIADLGIEDADGQWLLTCHRPGYAESERMLLATGRRVSDNSNEEAMRIAPLLSAEGADLFGGNYPAGERMSELTLHKLKHPIAQ